MKKKLIYIDQLVGPTSLDIINALTKYYTVHLYCGGIIKTYAHLSPDVRVHNRPAYSKKTMRSRVISWFAFYFRTIPPVLFTRKPEVFLVSNPPLNFFFGYVLNRIFGTRFTLLLFDIYPDIIIQSGYLSRTGVVARIWSTLNRIAFPKAHRIFTLSENLAKEVHKYEPSIENVRVVPNWVDSNEIKPIERTQNQFIKRFDLSSKLVVMYSGNMGKTHDIETIVAAADLLKAYDDIKFFLIGDGEKRPKLEEMVARLSLPNVTMLPFQDPEQFKHSIASADIGFVTLSHGFENYSVPSKTYYLMAAGCILFAIASKDSEMELLINKYECGYRFDSGNVEAVAAGILEVYNNTDLKEKLSRSARQAASSFTIQNAQQVADETNGT